jgi:hypothetical protein
VSKKIAHSRGPFTKYKEINMRLKVGKILLLSGLGLAGLMLIAYGGGYLYLNIRESQLDKEAGEFLAKTPKTEYSATAKTLDKLIKSVGFKPNYSANDSSVEGKLLKFVKSQIEGKKATLDPVPSELSVYLSQKRSALNAIEAHLNSSELPTWKFDSSTVEFNDPIPAFLIYIDLDRILVLKAIDDYKKGRSKEMLSALMASNKVKQALVNYPHPLGYLVSSLIARRQTNILRKLNGVPEAFKQQSMKPDFKGLGVKAYEFDNWYQYKAVKDYFQHPSKHPEIEDYYDYGIFSSPNFPIFIRDPIRRLSTIDWIQSELQRYNQLKHVSICSDRLNEAQKQVRSSWNSLLADSDSSRWIIEGQARSLEMELTQKVLTAKYLAAERGGKWPDMLPDLKSQVCPDQNWIYKVMPDGKMSISFSREIEIMERGMAEKENLFLTYLSD